MARRIALLIGNARFAAGSELEPLHGPPHDVAALGDVLADAERGGFEVTRFVDERRDVVLPAIEEALNGAEPDDLVVLFYAGHGKLDSAGRLCLATAETMAGRVRSTSIPVSELKDLVSQGNARSVVLLLDCCFSGAINKEFRGAVDDQLGLASDAHGLHILTAATGVQTARERDAESGGKVMGAFTRAIVEGIASGAADRDGDGAITLADLRKHLRESMRGQTSQYFVQEASGEPLIARARPPESREQKRLRRLGTWYNEGKIPEAIYAQLADAAGGDGDPKLVALVQRILDNKDMRSRQLVAAWEGATNPATQAEAPPQPPPRAARAAKPAAATFYADPPEPATTPSAPPRTADAPPEKRSRLPKAVFLLGIPVAIFGVGMGASTGDDEWAVMFFVGLLMMIAGAVWGGVQILGRIARSLGFR